MGADLNLASRHTNQFAWPWMGLLLGLGLALALAILWLRSPMADLLTLLTLLMLSGLASVAFGYAGMAWLWQGRVQLWLQITLTYLLGVVVVLGNIVVTAQMMFISSHDLPLLTLLVCFAAVIAAGQGVALSKVFARRLSVLQQGAARLAAGDLSARVAPNGRDELALLAEAFNHLASELAQAADERQRQEVARRELNAAISHDLRTPLASLRAMTEALADGVVDDAATTTRYYTTMRAQIVQLDQLIDDLFSLARLEAGGLKLELQPASPLALLNDVVAGISSQVVAKGVELMVDAAPTLRAALVAPQQIVRVFDNLLVNAIRHTPAGGHITVSAWEQPDAQLIGFAVTDTGEGIAPEGLPFVFERFYRGEKSRSRASGGAGLGLAIARSLVEAHGGTIAVESSPGQGTRVWFTVRRA